MANFGGSVKLTGESEYQKALKGISDNLKVVSSELKVVSTAYDKNDTSSKNLKAQSEVLNKKLEEQKTKVSVLKQALEEAKEQTGETSDTTKKWATELNNAQAEVNKTTNQINNLGKEVDETGEGFTVFKGILANLGTQAINGVISGVKSLASSLVNLTKEAVNSYAEFEQLEGGIKKLFGEENVEAVVKNANNAFSTARFKCK